MRGVFRYQEKIRLALNFKKLRLPPSIPFFQSPICGVSTNISDQNEAKQIVIVPIYIEDIELRNRELKP